MKKKSFLKSEQILFVFFSILFISISNLNAQGVEADFLLYSPSPVVTGMGGAGTAIPIDDPYNFFYNPAQLGLRDTNTNISFGIYPSSVNLSATNTKILFDNYAINGGYDFSKLLGGFPLSVGVGFLYQGIDYGEFTRTHESGQVSGTVHPYEKSATFSLGFGFNYLIKLSGGISYKLIWSEVPKIPGLYPYDSESMKGNADAFDLGILAEVPIITKMNLGENLNFSFSASAGYTFANWGGDMVYKTSNTIHGDPIARTARLGYGLRAGIDYKYKETDFKLIQIDWTSEANDLLVENVEKINQADTIYMSDYKSSPLGNINFLDNVILLKNTSTSAINRHGVKFSVFETADISFGRYAMPRSFNKSIGSTLGFSISTKGVFKFLAQEIKNEIIDFIAKHISIQYSYSRIKFDKSYYLNNIIIQYLDQKYNAIYLDISDL
ncbi:MAG: hypothetical protein EPN82_11865 [Bacteroidetes bacterium]|nr:MAG: hypothetical protein EPN82_11865 [Bacteroidota bacterium]